MNIDKRKLYGTVLGGIAFIVVILAFTYARYIWQSDDTDLTFSISDEYFKCETGQSETITSGSIVGSGATLKPTQDYKTNSLVEKFKVNNVGKAATTFSVGMKINSIDSALISEGLKYVLVVDKSGGANNCASSTVTVTDEDSGTTTGCYFAEDAEGNHFTGDFKDAEANNVKTLADVVPLPSNVRHDYYLFVYIDGNAGNSNNLVGKSMSFVLEVCEIVAFFDNNGGTNSTKFLKISSDSGADSIVYPTLPTPTKDNWSVAFDADGGSVSSGSTATKTGSYTFDGWYLDNGKKTTDNDFVEFSTKVNSNGSVTRKTNHTLHAKWNLSSSSCVSLPTVTKTGYTFAGWYDGDAKVTSYCINANEPPKNVTLKAKWTANIYSVTLDNQGATSAGTPKVYYQYETTKTINGTTCYYYTDSALTTCLTNGANIVKPAKTGYTFKGYFTSTSGSGTQYVNNDGVFINNIYKTVGDKTLYAHWVDDIAPTAPTYTAFFTDGSGNYTSGNWTNKEVRTTISTTEAGSGIEYIQYSSDKSEWRNLSLYVGALTQSGTIWSGTEHWTLNDRNETFYFRACDKAGNCSGASSGFNIRYDISAPSKPTYTAFFSDGSGNYTSGNWTNKEVRTTISATDDLSGISKIQYILTSGTPSVDSNWSTFSFGISTLTQSGSTWSGTENWELKNRNNSYYFRACDKLNQCSEYATYTIMYDIDAPTCTLTSTANLKASSQTIRASATGDTGGSNIAKYYLGTSSTGTPSSATLPSMSASAAGTYYLRLQDNAGNIGSCNVVEHSYKVHNMLLKTSGTKGTYNTTNYSTSSTATYIAPKSTTLTLASIYTIPAGASSNTFKGISKGAPSTTAATVSSTAPTLTANSDYALWFDRNEYTISLKAGNGISSVSPTSVAARYGATINLSTVTVSHKNGYSGTSWSKSSGSGSLSGTSFVVGAGAATLTVNATALSTPSSGTIPNSATLTPTSTSRIYGATTSTLTASQSTSYDSGVTLKYSFGTSTSSTGTYSYGSATTSNKITIAEDSHYGSKYYKVQIYAEGEGGLKSNTVTSNAATVTLNRATITLNANGCGTSSPTKGYVEYNSTDMYIAATNSTSTIPSFTVNSGYVFNGWYTETSGGSKVLNSNGNLTGTAVANYTSATTWQPNGDKTLYAQCSISHATITFSAGNGIKSVSPSSTVVSVGATLNLDNVISVTHKDGYSGKSYTATSGANSVSGSTYIVPAGGGAIKVNATTLASPVVTLTPSSTYKVYNYEDTVLTANKSTTYNDGGVTVNYAFGNSSSSGGSYSYASSSTANTTTITKNSHFGSQYYRAKAYAVGDGGMTSSTSTSSAVVINLHRAAITLNANSCVTNSPTQIYVEYDKGDMFSSSTGDDDIIAIPATANSGYIFNGWYTDTSGGTQVINSNGIPIAAVAGYRANNLWQVTSDKTLYAQCSKANYTITFAAGNGVKSVSPTSVSGTIGTTIDLSTITVSNIRGYSGTSWTRNSSVGTLSGSTYVIGNGNETLTVSATTLKEPNIEPTFSDYTSIYNNGLFAVYDEYDNAFIDPEYGAVVTRYWSFGISDSINGTYSYGSFTASSQYTYSDTNHYGTKYLKFKLYATDGILTSSTVTSDAWSYTLRNAEITLNANSCGTLGTGTNPFYVKNGNITIYDGPLSLDGPLSPTTASMPSFTPKTGYTFNGWYNEASGGSKVLTNEGSLTGTAVTNYTTSTAWKVKNDSSLYAQCTANKYVVKYNCNSGTGTMSNSTFTYGSNGTLSAEACSRGDYVFMGWAKSSTATSAAYTNSQSGTFNMSSTNGATVNLYAVWKLYNYKVTSSNGTQYSDTLKQAATLANVAGSTVTLLKGTGTHSEASTSISTFTKNATLVIGDGKTIDLKDYLVRVARGATLTISSKGKLVSNQTPVYTYGAYVHSNATLTTRASHANCADSITCNTLVVGYTSATTTTATTTYGGTATINSGSITHTNTAEYTVALRTGPGKLTMSGGWVTGNYGGISSASSSSVVITGGTIAPAATGDGSALLLATSATGHMYFNGGLVTSSIRGARNSGKGNFYMQGGTINCSGATDSACVVNGYDAGTNIASGNSEGRMLLYNGKIIAGYLGVHNLATETGYLAVGTNSTASSVASTMLIAATAASGADGVYCGQRSGEFSRSRCYFYNNAIVNAKGNGIYNRASNVQITYGASIHSATGTTSAIVYNASLGGYTVTTLSGSTATTQYGWGRVVLKQGMISGGSNGISSKVPSGSALQIGSSDLDLYNSTVTSTKKGPLIKAGYRGVHVGSAGTEPYLWKNGVLCGQNYYSYHDMSGVASKWKRSGCTVKTGTRVSGYNCGWYTC